ncbi:5-oxoprolinase subunit PxpA [Hydromonas duriensis]|uniref:UPF0271 protein n=1 Tax=Hydromonas duriensis TaxID=1527608 RepID=A0A4R6Y8W9_9BURK|nr:5-oxoprolinase subunit PxpA [Hydromonas duriensis]TDR31848.1 UPF0271 protein [Hydromonas duriensis]
MSKTHIDINCDMGEGLGMWRIGDDIDLEIMPLVSSINLAAGFHAGDPNIIHHTIIQAKQHGLGVGVHPGFRDLLGFGRRHIRASAQELVNDTIYQLGAVREFVNLHGLTLQHFKLHGALYMHAAVDEAFAELLVDTLHRIDDRLPILVMAGSVIERMARAKGHPVIREFYADRDYDDSGSIVFTRRVGSLSSKNVADKVMQACLEGTVNTVQGNTISIEFESICIHSDTEGALALMQDTRKQLDQAGISVQSFA